MDTRRVLLVDDQPDMRGLLRVLLESGGCTIVGEATDGDEAIAVVQRVSVDAIVLDWEMPVRTGIDALPELRRLAPEALIVMFSSRAADDARPQALAAGADVYLEKSAMAALVDAVCATEVASRGHDSTGPRRLHAVPEPARPPWVLVVDDDPTARRLLRIALELEGAEVTEAGSVGEGLDHLNGPSAIVLDRRLPDGDGLDLLPHIQDRNPDARVVVCSNLDDDHRPAWVLHVPKTDMDAVVGAVGITPGRPVAEVFDLNRAELVEQWHARCRLNELDAIDPLAEALIDPLNHPAVATPATSSLTGLIPLTVTVEHVVRELTCLRSVLTDHIDVRLPAPDLLAAANRISGTIDELILTLVAREADRLRNEAHTDPLTGLGNRRAFEHSLGGEVDRATRYRHPFSVVVIDIDGLKAVNDRFGHDAGDAALRQMGDALRGVLRVADAAFRVGGDEFVLILPETPKRHVSDIVERLMASGAPAFSWGAATYVDDTADRAALITIADQHLLERRRNARSS